jgi:hypothetical protein
MVLPGRGGVNVSTTFQTHERPVAFSDFMADVDSGAVEQVTITGHEIAGISRTDKERFRTYAPSRYDGLAPQLIARHFRHRDGADAEVRDPLLHSWADRCSSAFWPSSCGR